MAQSGDAFREESVSTETVKCSGCGANMVFDPESQQLFCPHCGTKIGFNTSDIAKELDISDGFSKDKEWSKEETSVFRCDNCGAEVVLSKNETAKCCPFCGTAHVEKSDMLLGLRPNAVLPFKFGKDKALDNVKIWAKKRFFAPKKFKKNLTTENLHGVYMPSFTFDSHTFSQYVGRIGTTHVRTVGSGKNQRTETYIVWRTISGVFAENFDDLLVTAGSKFDQKKVDKLSPFDTNKSSVYSEKFLLGFMAYRYDSELTDCWGFAKKRMDACIRKGILSRYNYDHLDYLNVSTKHEAVTYKYVMLPVYVGNFNYSKKVYNFFVNGSSGKIYGKTPKSALKILGVIGACLAVISAVTLLLLL